MNYQKIYVQDALKLLAVSGIIASSFVAPNLVIGYGYLSKKWQKYKRGDVGLLIRRLHRQDMVKLTEKNGSILIELSDKGKRRLLEYDFENMDLKKKHDGKFRVLMFDIPNKKRQARDVFRSKLKELGFQKLQESVFITPYECKKELEFIAHFLQIKDHVVLLQTNKIEIGPQFSFKSVYK